MKLHANVFKLGTVVACAALLSAAPTASAITVGLPVTVTNNASNPVPVTGAVGVTSLPSVTINNSTPVNVRDAENPAHRSFSHIFAFEVANANSYPNLDYVVPAGKQLVVEAIDGTVNVTSPQKRVSVSLLACPPSGCPALSEQAHPLMLTYQYTDDNGWDHYSGYQLTKIYIPAGFNVHVANTAATGAGTAGTIFMTGYLVDAP